MTGTRDVTPQPGMRQLPTRRASLLGLLVWWVAIAAGVSLLAAALVDVAYSRVVYFLVVMPVCGVLLFPAAWAANRWLTRVIVPWVRRP